MALSRFLQQTSPLLPGLLLSSAISGIALWGSHLPLVQAWGFGTLTLAILCGIAIGNTLSPQLAQRCASGVLLAKQQLLRLGIILYGLRLTLQQVTAVGLTGLLIDILTLCSTFLLACWLGRHLFKLDPDTALLIGAGSSICGAAAVLATEPLLRTSASKVSVAVATVVIFGTLALFIYPWLYQLNAHYQWLNISEEAFGIFIGSTVHEVAQVVAAGQHISPQVENTAVITKMLRVMMLAPFLLLLAFRVQQRNRQRHPSHSATSAISIPWFAVLFILVTGVNSLHLLPQTVVTALVMLDTLLLTMAMAALGLTTHFRSLRQAGLAPMLLALLLFLWLLFGGAAINLLIHQWR